MSRRGHRDELLLYVAGEHRLVALRVALPYVGQPHIVLHEEVEVLPGHVNSQIGACKSTVLSVCCYHL